MSIKLYQDRYRRYGGDWRGQRFGFVSCRWINRVFNIPKDISTLWISVHTEPDRDREKVRVKKYYTVCECRPTIITQAGNSAVWIRNSSLDKKLTPYIGKTMYLECWYE